MHTMSHRELKKGNEDVYLLHFDILYINSKAEYLYLSALLARVFAHELGFALNQRDDIRAKKQITCLSS